MRDGPQQEERLAWLALFPLLMTGSFYILPRSIQAWTSLQFLPQVFSYLGLAIWMQANSRIGQRLGMVPIRMGQGIRWGCMTGMLLGIVNAGIILWGIPKLGWDIEFLKETPHAKVPMLMMVPWFILFIAVCVELNFRGFLLGRLVVLFEREKSDSMKGPGCSIKLGTVLAVVCSAFAFAFDPFMVATFKHLHWIAVWDGLVWGWLWIRLRNLMTVIVAHTVEVVILYVAVRIALT